MQRLDVPTDLLAGCEAGDDLLLPEEQSHYVRDVLRMKAGEEVELFDGDGSLARTRLIAVDDEVIVEIEKLAESTRGESPIRCVLFQAIPKGKRWKWILEKATELGVDAVVPLETKRTIVQIPKQRLKRRMPRWEKILSSATRQCERTVVPSISGPVALSEAAAQQPCDVHLIAHPTPGAPTPAQVLNDVEGPLGSVGIWIGPEGGFSDEEVQTLSEKGMRPVRLGPRILRADTAGITALTLVQAARGDLGAHSE